MGFRNPLTSISADRITSGALRPGVVIRSAAAGNRFELAQVGALGALRFYAGVAGESPAQINAESTGGASPSQVLTIAGDQNASGTAPRILLLSEDAPAGGKQSRITLAADVVWLNGQQLDLGSWTPYTPTWTGAAVNPSLGNSTLTGRYKRLGKTVHVRIVLVIGTSGVTGGSGTWSWSLPVAASGQQCAVAGWLQVAGSYTAACTGVIPAGAGSITLVQEGRNTLSSSTALTAGSLLVLSATYEVA